MLVAHLDSTPSGSAVSVVVSASVPVLVQKSHAAFTDPAPWEITNYKDKPAPRSSPTPPFTGSLLLPGWHLVPDPEPSRANLSAVVTAIARSPVPIRTALVSFEAPAYDAPATSADWAATIKSVGAALAPPAASTSSAPISGWSPSPVPATPLDPVPPVSPPAAPPSEGHALSIPPEDKADVVLACNLLVLQSTYLQVQPDILLTVLERKKSAATALGWLSTIKEIKSLVVAMQEVFPSALLKHISHLVQTLGGEMSSMWSVLSGSYESPWSAVFTSSAVQRKVSRSAMRRGPQ